MRNVAIWHFEIQISTLCIHMLQNVQANIVINIPLPNQQLDHYARFQKRLKPKLNVQNVIYGKNHILNYEYQGRTDFNISTF